MALLQNRLDTHHYACHFMSFWEALGGTTEGGVASAGRHDASHFSAPRGHVHESEQIIPEIMNSINQDSFTTSSMMPTIHAVNE